MRADPVRNLLYVACGNFTAFALNDHSAAFTAGVLIVNLTTGAAVKLVDLTAIPDRSIVHVANDLIFDEQGNLYVSDTNGQQVWKVTPSGTATVFSSNPNFQKEKGQLVGLQGVEHPPNSNYILVGKIGTGRLFKIPLSHPNSVTEVRLTPSHPAGLDGIRLLADGRMVVVGNQFPANYYIITSTDQWVSGTVQTFPIPEFYFPSSVCLTRPHEFTIGNTSILNLIQHLNTFSFVLKPFKAPKL